MKRPLVLVGSLLGLLAGLVGAFILTLGMMILTDLLSRIANINELTAVLIALIITFSGSAIFCICTISKWRAKPTNYKKVNVILAIVFNIVAGSISLLFNSSLFYILSCSLFISALLFIIDLLLEKKRLERYNQTNSFES